MNVGSLDTRVPPSWKYPEFPEFELSSCNKMEEQKEFNKPLFFNIYVLVNKYFASIPKSHQILM